MTPFGMRMRDLRAARGLTQQQQAEQLNVSTAYQLSNEVPAAAVSPFVDQIWPWPADLGRR